MNVSLASCILTLTYYIFIGCCFFAVTLIKPNVVDFVALRLDRFNLTRTKTQSLSFFMRITNVIFGVAAK